MEYIAVGIVGVLIGAAVCALYFVKKLSEQSLEAQTWKTKYEVGVASLDKSKTDAEQMQRSLSNEFQNLAQKIFDEKVAKLDQSQSKTNDHSLRQLENLLNPLKEKIKDFESRVEKSFSDEAKERNTLKFEIGKLLELNQSMSKEAHNLALALKGENKTQGNWGEMILENILERSGLRKGEEYLTQETLRGDNGQLLRPDVIVRLPDGKHLIVDSKMTLNAYEASVTAENEDDRQKFAAAHIESLKRHISDLSEKKYYAAEKLISPDFVMLFMPLEPAFAMAFKLKPELFEQAWEKNIAIVSPTTLLATLRTVSSLWKQERQQQNALEIAKRGGELYDKFAGIVKDLESLGDRLQLAQKAHTEVMTKISSGKGNLISQVEKLKTLGAKADKSLPPAQVD